MNSSARRRSGLLRAYVAAVFVLGLVAFVTSLRAVALAGLPLGWIALGLLAICSQFSKWSSIKVPGVAAHLSISEAMLFMIVVMYGGAPAVVTLAVDGLLFSLKQELKGKRRSDFDYAAFDFAEPALSMWAASTAYYWLLGSAPLSVHNSPLADLAVPALAMSAVYFLMNSGLNAFAEALALRTSPLPLWRKHFQDLGANYFASVSIAAVLSHHLVGATVFDAIKIVVVTAPLVLTSYVMLTTSMRSLEDERRHAAEKDQLNLTLAEALAMTAEAKDRSTSRGHIRRVRALVLRLAHTMGVKDPQTLQAIEFAGLLHDYGKTSIPDHILNKPGKLTDGEYEVMKTHAAAGADLVSRIGFKFPVVPIIRHHHENWDGTGYPDRLQGEQIPLGARLLSVVDCYDALRDDRPYRRALTHDQAMEILLERSGSMYDPAAVEAFGSLDAELRSASRPDMVPPPAVPVLEPAGGPAPGPGEDTTAALPIEIRLSTTRTLVQLQEQLSRLDPLAGVDATCEIVSQQLLRLAPASLVVFYRRDDAADEMAAAYAVGFGEAMMRTVRMPIGHKVTGWVAVNGGSVINADSKLDLDNRLDDVEPRFRSLLSVPLPHADRTIGVVTLYALQDQAFREEQRQALDLVRHAVGQAFWRAIQNDRTRSADDSCAEGTGPATRQAFEVLLAMDDQAASRFGRSVGVLCVQHHGDASTMAGATMAVTKAIRVADLIFAPTDDSLVVLMRDADPDAGRIVSERIAAALPPSLVPPSADGSPLSLGYACSPHDGDTIRKLLETARLRLSRSRPQAAPLNQPPLRDAVPVLKGGRA